MYYVYILRKNVSWYIGSTCDLKRRFREHSKDGTCKLLYYEAYSKSILAKRREYTLKQYGGAWRALHKRLDD